MVERIRFTTDYKLFKPGDIISATPEEAKKWLEVPGAEIVQPDKKEIPEPEIEPEPEIKKEIEPELKQDPAISEKERLAENQIQKDMDLMERKGFYDDPTRVTLLDQYEVFEKDDKGKPNGHINCPRLAKLILEADETAYIVLKDTLDILRFNGSFYEQDGENTIKQRVNYYLEDECTEHRIKEVLTFIKSYKYTDRRTLEPPDQLINLRNGTYDRKTKQLLPHNPEYHFLNELPINYQPGAKCDKILEFFQSLIDINDIPLIQEFFGDCLQRTYKFKRAFIFVGEKDTGKSQIVNIVEEFLGHDNTANVNLYDLCTDIYSPFELYGKMGNFASELDPCEIKHIDKFLAITGGDWVHGHRKFLRQFKFKNYAKLLFACNQVPDVSNKNEAYYVRWIVIAFSNHIPEEDQIPNYYQTVCTEEELSGLLNWALEGLERLEKQHGYSEHKSLEEVRSFMQKGSNPIREFVDQYIIADPDAETLKEELYLSYVEFCKNLGYPYKADNVFSRFFKPELPHGAIVTEGQPRKTSHKRTWKGILCTYSRIGDLLTLDQYDNQCHDKTEGALEGK
jgi:P4 family phage/plasmid primase-like protien